MKKAVYVILQMILFVVCEVAGLFMHPFHSRMMLASTPGTTRYFDWDGVLLMLIVAVVILLIAATAKKIKTALPLTSIALVLALALGLAMKVGFGHTP